MWNYWLLNYCDYGLKIAKTAGIIFEYIRMWLLLLLIPEKMVISKCLLIKRVLNSVERVLLQKYYLVSMLKFDDNQEIQRIFLSNKIVS